MSVSPAEFQGQAVTEVRNGRSRILIAPEAGGRLLLWEVADRPILYWPREAVWAHPAKIRGGNPLLFPFLGRHFVDGVIDRWRDGAGTVRDMSMHGFARNAVFTLRESPDDLTVVMELAPTPATRPGYPFDFRFRVIHELGDQRLTVRFETANLGPTPLPYYAGHHFYFALPAEERSHWTLQLPPVQQAHQSGDGAIVPTGTRQDRFVLDDPALQDTFHILQGPGSPVLWHPDGRKIEIACDSPGAPWHTVTTWTEKPDSPFYCVEPWLGLPNAIHHGQGLRQIEPGTVESATCSLVASGW